MEVRVLFGACATHLGASVSPTRGEGSGRAREHARCAAALEEGGAAALLPA
ncbi:MAG: hypothetical protein ACLGI5_04555 [Thermoleophilia bacterium]